MASKRAISYQWKLFFPLAACLWVSIFGMLIIHQMSMRKIREELVADQLRLVTERLLSKKSYDYAKNFAVFSNVYYDVNENYDPLTIYMWDLKADTLVFSVGDQLRKSSLPTEKLGVADIDNGGVKKKYIYSVGESTDSATRVYALLPYTKVLDNKGLINTTTYWIIFITIGILATLISLLTTRYLSKNIMVLRKFAYDVGNKPETKLKVDEIYDNDEVGDVFRQIVKIYNQRLSEVERREKEHRVAMNAIEEKNRIKREMTGNINHELKTPVGIIQGYIDTILGNPDMDDETLHKFLLKTRENVHRLTELIKDVTAITRLESGGKLVNVTDVDFHDFVFALASNIEDGNVLQGKMTFNMDLPMNCHVLANESLLNSVILNLVKNAVAYSEGTECHLIYVGEDDDFFYFRFYDNGVGVSPEHLPHMFERFYRVNSGRARNAGGTGLGLSIVEVTIESFGGKIDVVNHFPSGLEFNFSLVKYDSFIRRKKASTEPLSHPEPPTE